ncbi:unnamed protein product, partial [Laminaria digitata]
RPVCVGITWRRLITAGAMRQWRPRLGEVNREVRQYGVWPGGKGHMGLRTRTLHETGNWLVLTDCLNAFNTVKRAAVLEEVANCVPALTPSVAKCYGTRPCSLGGSKETWTIACSSGVQQGDPMGPAMFCLALRPMLKRFRQELEGEGVEAFAYMDDVSLGLMGITANTVRAFAFLRRGLDDIGIVVSPAKTVALPPKGHAPTAEKISLRESIDVRIAEEGRVTVVSVPIGTEEYVRGRAMKVIGDGGTYRLARCLTNTLDKQTAALISVESLGQRTSYLERALDPVLSLEACRRADNGAQWAYKNILELPRAAETQ